MIIKREVMVTSDVSQDNEVLFIDGALLSCPLSAVALISSFDSVSNSQVVALDFFDDAIRRQSDEFEPWLLVGHATWQPDNRIIRYRKLWANLELEGLRIPDGERIGEKLIESDKGVKFFDAVRCERFVSSDIAALLRANRAGALLYVKKDEAYDLIGKLIASSWVKDNPFAPSVLLNATCGSSAMVSCLLGEFDDVEAGCAMLGRYEIIHKYFDLVNVRPT